jgi:hypothetical protein
MERNSNNRKILKVALYTSPLIGILSITPLFIVRAASYQIYPRSILSITLIIFLAWMINLAIINYWGKFELRTNFYKILRYFVSYLLSASFILIAMRMRKLIFASLNANCEISQSHSPYATVVMAISLNTVILILLDLLLLRE